MKETLAELLWRNPMLVDAKRFRRRFFGNKAGSSNVAVIILAVIVYIGVFGLVASFPDIPPVAILTIQLLFFCFAMPAVLHNAISGEREKRTWDFLATAPVTKAQIVLGKYLAGCLALLAVVVLMSIPIVYSFFQSVLESYRSTWYGTPPSFSEVMGQEAVTIGYGLSLGAFSLFVSTRTRRVFNSMAIVHVAQLLFLVVYPILVSIGVGIGGDQAGENLLFLHPFVSIFTNLDSETTSLIRLWNGWLTALCHLGLAAVFLAAAISSLNMESPD